MYQGAVGHAESTSLVRHGGGLTSMLTGLSTVLIGMMAMNGNLMALPTITVPDPNISRIFVGNWENTLKPCQIQVADPSRRPWMVDAANHYSGWYPAIDVKYQTRAYLFCEKNLSLVLTGWQYTIRHCRLPNGGIKITEFPGDSGTVYPYRSVDGTTVAYPLRASGSIDLLLTGDLIYRFSQDRAWLRDNIPYMRDAAGWLEGWIDEQGMLESWDYDHDSLMRRGTDGTGQASAFLAFNRLAAMENVLGNRRQRGRFKAVANKLAVGAKNVLWDSSLGYFFEYAERNNIARSDRLGSIGGVSSEYGSGNLATKAIDGVLGYGPDLVGVGAGAGQSEWATKGETAGAWIQVNLKAPTAINRVILSNRQAPGSSPAEAFALGHLTFSDGSTVPVTFAPGVGSRALATFPSRTVNWVKFTAERMQAEGGGNAGLAEFEITPTAEPYLKYTHGMSDVNFALVGYGVADDAQTRRVWQYFRAHEDAFYSYKGLHAPTWTTELPETYTGRELNAINPQKDRTALGRIWRHDAWMRKRMGDGAGIYRTIGYANDLYDRSSGGGRGFFGERYDLGRFKPGEDGQDSTPKYAEYPAEYNATIIGEILMGVSADIDGTIIIEPCVPPAWYQTGFGIENPGILKDRDVGYVLREDRIAGWVKGKPGRQSFRVRLPPGIKTACVLQDGKQIPHKESGRYATFALDVVAGKTHTFSLRDAD